MAEEIKPRFEFRTWAKNFGLVEKKCVSYLPAKASEKALRYILFQLAIMITIPKYVIN